MAQFPSVFPTPILADVIVYTPPGGTGNDRVFAGAAGTISAEITSVTNTGAFTDGTVAAYAVKWLNVYVNNVTNDSTTQITNANGATPTLIWNNPQDTRPNVNVIYTFADLTLVPVSSRANNVGICNNFNAIQTLGGGIDLTGLDCGAQQGFYAVLSNESGQTVTVKHDDTHSSDGNQIFCNTGADLSLTTGKLLYAVYRQDLDGGAGGWLAWLSA